MTENVTQATHTPGPWTAKEHEDRVMYRHTCWTISTPRVHIADTKSSLGLADRLENEANAHLIEASPDLLAAAKDACNVLAALVTGDLKKVGADSPALAALRAAIAKAEGRA